MKRPIAILYEHPEWFKPLFAALDERGADYVAIDAADHTYDPADRDVPYSLVVNRMSPSAWMRGHRDAIFHTLRYLEHLEDLGAPVFNGAKAFRFELSKAAQYSLMARLGLRHPATRVLSRSEQALTAASELRYPVLVKPNIGGSGAGIQSFAAPNELAAAVKGGRLDFGIDHVGLLQEHLPAEGDAIVRIEILNGEYLYAVRLLLTPNVQPVPGRLLRAARHGRWRVRAWPADRGLRAAGGDRRRGASPGGSRRNGRRRGRVPRRRP